MKYASHDPKPLVLTSEQIADIASQVSGGTLTKSAVETVLTGAITSHTHAYEAANANIQAHVTSTHAPAAAQVNADITKGEIEAKLTGEITSHSHSGGGMTQAQILTRQL